MSTFFNENEADEVVNKILSERETVKDEPVIIAKNASGEIVQAVEFDVITRESVQTCLDEARHMVTIWESALADYDKLAGPATDTPIANTGDIPAETVDQMQSVTPVEAAPIDPNADAVVEIPVAPVPEPTQISIQ